MKWDSFLKKTGGNPVIETESLLAGITDSRGVKVQLSRWRKAGKIIQARRGVYLLAEPYRKKDVYEPYLASILKRPSYISMEKALEFHSMIPEAVAAYTCVTTKRPGKFISQAGAFLYRHIKTGLFWGYESVKAGGQAGFIACPEKALLDLIYFRGMKISQAWLRQMRLQNMEKIDLDKLFTCAERFKSRGMLRAASEVKKYFHAYSEEEKVL